MKHYWGITAIFTYSLQFSQAENLLENLISSFMARCGLLSLYVMTNYRKVLSWFWVWTWNIQSKEVRMQVKKDIMGLNNKTATP